MKVFTRDFVLVLIGQCISLFGNAILRFALPLHLLTETGSASLFGLVLAVSALPMLVLTPIGGIVADRVNKRNVMVILDAITAMVVAAYTFSLGHVDLVALTMVTMLILFGIQGAYTPSVSASLPVLVKKEDLGKANSLVSIVTNISQLIGPVIGGMLYGTVGLPLILMVAFGCFVFSSIMEMFIHIPFTRQEDNRNVVAIAAHDLKEGFHFMVKGEPVVFKITVMATGLNIFLSTLFIVGLPVIVTRNLGYPKALASQLYGYAEGGYAIGGLIGAIVAATLLDRMPVKSAHVLITICAVLIFPLGLVLQFSTDPTMIYAVTVLVAIGISISVTAFSVKMLAYLQGITPEHLIGKVIAFVFTVSMAAMPIGQAIYGFLFDLPKELHYLVVYGGGVASLIVAFYGIHVFTTGHLPEIGSALTDQAEPNAESATEAVEAEEAGPTAR